MNPRSPGIADRPAPAAAATVPGLCLSVVSHGHGPLVRALLEDLARLAPRTLRRVVLTVNVPESERFEDLAGALPLQIVHNASPRGFGANHNAAFRLAGEPCFAIVNPDVRLERDPFDALLGALSAPGVGMVAPRVVDAQGRVAPSARRLYTPLEIASRLWRRERAAARPEWLAGMFLVVRREAFERVGGFDERYFLYIEDVDLGTRMRRAGLTLRTVDEATVLHLAQHASHRSLRHLRWHVGGMARYWTSPGFRWALVHREGARPADAAPAKGDRGTEAG